MPLKEKKTKAINPLILIFIFFLFIIIICFIIFLFILNRKNINNLLKKIEYLEQYNNQLTEKNTNLDNNFKQLSTDYSTYKNNVFNDIFPIGSYYITSSNTNPSILFGGEWSQIKDRFLIGASDKYKVNSSGGEEKHKLTENEMPSHRHNTLDWAHRGMYLWGGNDNSGDGPAAGYGYRTHAIDTFTSWTGGNDAHNNIPPYIAAFIWRRIA